MALSKREALETELAEHGTEAARIREALIIATREESRGFTVDRLGDFVGTFSSVRFHALDPRPEDITPEDLAHHLALRCRWNCACHRFYSVAEHSLRVAAVANTLAFERGIPREIPVGAYALLHDGAEALLPDVPRPMKGFLIGWLALEAKVQEAVLARFALPPLPPEAAEIVDEADAIVLAVEAHELFPEGHVTPTRIPLPALTRSLEVAIAEPYRCWRPDPAVVNPDWDEIAILTAFRAVLDSRGVLTPPATAVEETAPVSASRWKEAMPSVLTESESRGEAPAHLRALLDQGDES